MTARLQDFGSAEEKIGPVDHGCGFVESGEHFEWPDSITELVIICMRSVSPETS